ncbi:MAG TPA: protein kinase, partial [Gammaproteobacteria bacterium]|nr:protein kinase [Gammaproteobacteria bacterium]
MESRRIPTAFASNRLVSFEPRGISPRPRTSLLTLHLDDPDPQRDQAGPLPRASRNELRPNVRFCMIAAVRRTLGGNHSDRRRPAVPRVIDVLTMPLSAHTRFGSFEIVDVIGVGGMGEVYRATDVNLARDVAIKVLPSSLAADPERIARFAREARTLGALNHPNVAHVYGLEKA